MGAQIYEVLCQFDHGLMCPFVVNYVTSRLDIRVGGGALDPMACVPQHLNWGPM